MPDFAHWENLLVENQHRLSNFLNIFSIGEIHRLREEIINSAISYTQRLETIAFEHGIILQKACGVTSFNKLIMTGHQPTIYHSGILAKNLSLNTFAQETKTAAINIIIDTDSGNGGNIYYPSILNAEPEVQSISISDNSPLYLYQKIVGSNEIENTLNLIHTGLTTVSLNFVTAKSKKVLSLYKQLSGMSLCEANTIARRYLSPSNHYYELPLSLILKSSYIQTLFSKILADGDAFSNQYNQALHTYRLDHKIKNNANPFPDLKPNETPFWLIDSSKKDRSSFFNSTKPENCFLAPKAFLITLLLRFCLSDLFIHGKGGAKYDQFLDYWVSIYYKMQAPSFVSVSEDRYLFPDIIEEYENYLSVLSRRREISGHLEKHLRSSLFNTADKSCLNEFLNSKTQLLSCLQKKDNTSTQRKLLGKEIKALDLCIKDFLNHKLAVPNESKLANMNTDFLYFREYPFFFFT
ncbi:MAG: hypothetical protein A2Y40_02700 [Candidatus Margulisbacteria bacterium GWF2_35_9]|nr:MAG: hypothetical protein A2Y40_02700 [Candidatus Margulisbacteria bacterium GWF2_35_9]